MKRLILTLIILLSYIVPSSCIELCIGQNNSCQNYIEVTQEEIFTLNIIINNHPIQKDIIDGQFLLKFDPKILKVEQEDAIPGYPAPDICSNRIDYKKCMNQLTENDNFPLWWRSYPQGIDTTKCAPIEDVKNYFSNTDGEIFYWAWCGLTADGQNFNLQTAPVVLVSITFKAIASTCSQGICNNTELQFIPGYAKIYLVSQSSSPTIPILSNLQIKVKDTIAPVSSVNELSQYQASKRFLVTWTGTDENGSGIKYYDVEYKEKAAEGNVVKNWTPWLTNFEGTQCEFEGNLGHSYCFRSRAIDYENNVELYPSAIDGDTCTKVLKYVIGAFQNPGKPNDIIINIKDKYNLLGGLPPEKVEVQQGVNKTSISMNKVAENTYTGIYHLLDSTDSNAKIIVNNGEEVEYFTVVKVKRGEIYNIDSFDNKLNIKIKENTFNNDIFFTIFKEEIDENNNELIKISNKYKLGPKDINLNYPAELSFYYNELDTNLPSDKIGIFLQENNNLKFIGSRIKENRITTMINSFGDYYLYADITPPMIELLKVESNERVNIECLVKDNGSGVDKTSVELIIDNIKVNHNYDERTNILSYKSEFNISEGNHNLIIKAKDKLGNLIIKNYEFNRGQKNLAINFFYPIPNPSNGKVYFRYNLNSNPDGIKIRIFNIQGRLIKEIERHPNGKEGNLEIDELVNLPNGVYIYQVIVYNSGENVKKVGKLVILK